MLEDVLEILLYGIMSLKQLLGRSFLMEVGEN